MRTYINNDGTMNLILLTCVVLIGIVQTRQPPFYTTYNCTNGLCQRIARPVNSIDPEDLKSKGHHTTLTSCRLVCDKNAGLWPIPTGSFSGGNDYVEIHPGGFYFDFTKVPHSASYFLLESSEVLLKNLHKTCGHNCAEANTTLSVHVVIESDSLDLDWGTREDYTMDIGKKENKIIVNIIANTVFGARHAFETLSQLTAPIKTADGGNGLVILDYAVVADRPIFSHRGLLIDTARNFLSVKDILRTIDGLAATKMNVLHWHATDSQSFPLEIRSIPAMAKFGAYSPDRIYTVDDMSHIISYAKVRGVRVILELDSPSHAGAGWDWGESAGLGKLAVCVNQQPWRNFCIQPPCGQLNPVNTNTYKILRDVYKDILDIWGSKSVLHLGGDEVFLNCWNATPEITSAMMKRGLGRRAEDFLQLWGEFHRKQLEILDDIKRNSDHNVILWSSYLTSPEFIEKYLNKQRFIIQTWVESNSKLPDQLLKLGYKLIVSTKNAWYLDHGFWGRTKYHTWHDTYNNRIPRVAAVLGGEACMWGEYVNGGSLDTRVWPRTAAIAERLWSDPEGLSTTAVEPRLQAQRERLQARGIYSDALAPEWCAQHERQCA